MKKLNALDWIAVVLVVVGAINWGLVGLFGYNLVADLFGQWETVERVIYDVVGLAGIYLIISLLAKGGKTA